MALWTATAVGQETPFDIGEHLTYNLRYRYGLLMPRAATAEFTVTQPQWRFDNSVQTRLTFRTVGIFDHLHKIRDTITAILNSRLEPLHSVRTVNEGGAHFCEELIFNSHSAVYSEARVIRSNRDGVKFDTIISGNGAGFDLLGILVYSRTIDYPALVAGQSFRLINFVGKDRLNIIVRYTGKETLDVENLGPTETFRLEVDAADRAFNESKNALEIWISADNNRLPVKLKAKLKIGAGEATLASWNNLKHPLNQ
jgi:hypothetical protein